MSTRYTVQTGDTLPLIARRFGINVDQLAQTNNITDLNLIFLGQVLMIPDEGGTGIGVTGDFVKENVLPIAPKQRLDWELVKEIFGRGSMVETDIFKVTFPRYDLKVSIGTVSIEPELALTSWAAFQQVGNHSRLMGDLVLLESEVEPVIIRLIESGLELTALHNHLIRETPRVMFLHIAGIGDPVLLALGVKSALSLTNTPFIPPNLQQVFPPLDWSAFEEIFGRRGQRKGRVLLLSIPRAEIITENGVQLPPAMGVAHAVNFQAEGQNIVATTGDFVLLANEVNPVVRIFEGNGISVTAIHNHMLMETPRLFYLHFWAIGQSESLVMVLKRALERTKSILR